LARKQLSLENKIVLKLIILTSLMKIPPPSAFRKDIGSI
jgi:hypothetical protein